MRWLAVALLAGCAGAPSPYTLGSAFPASTVNIYWNKASLHVKYAPGVHGQAILSYWGPNGYYTDPPTCKNGGKISATARRTWGNRSKYLHVLYWFKARSKGPDYCTFTAILDNTGSPPIATIEVRIVAK